GVHPRLARRSQHRPVEHRAGADHQAELVAAARGEHCRLPLPAAGLSASFV
ncbi:uncharacterized protein METZ01_LOCUS218105, partial [marine metagenome]